MSLGRLSGLSSRSLQLKTISSWSDGVGFSSSIAHESSSPIAVVVNVRSIIDLFCVRLGLVIVPGSLFKIRLNLSIMSSRDVASVVCVIRGFHTGLWALKSPNRIVRP